MSKTLREYQIGFYFNLNNLAAESEAIGPEYAVHTAAYKRFAVAAKRMPFWSEPSSHPDDNFDIYPYDVCGNDVELEDHNGLTLFPVWISSEREMPAEHIAALRKAAQDAFEQAGQEAGMPVAYIHTQVYREWLVAEMAILPE